MICGEGMRCDVCGDKKSALSARWFACHEEFRQFGEDLSNVQCIWYCDECADAERKTEPWKRGYLAGLYKREQNVKGQYVKTVVCSALISFVVASALWFEFVLFYFR